MCLVITYVHAECGHGKKPKVVECCPDYRSGKCTLTSIHRHHVYAPSLCVACFRAEEAKIDAAYHYKVQVIRGMMAECEAAQEDRQVRGRAQGAANGNIAQFERDLVDVKKWRDGLIQSFRSEQEVWADG